MRPALELPLTGSSRRAEVACSTGVSLRTHPFVALGQQHRTENLILHALGGADMQDSLRSTVPIELIPGMRLSEPGRRPEHLFFPVSGCIATEALTRAGESILISLIGMEGFAGWCGLLDHPQHMHAVTVLTPGRALRLKIGLARQEFERGGPFTKLGHAFMYMQVAQMGQSVLCNRFHSVSQRLARWILELHCRSGSEPLLVTHEMLARMLGARRSSVTVAATEMQDQGLIEYRRGKLRIVDSARLEEAACECFALVEEAYAHMLRAYQAAGSTAGCPDGIRSGAAPTDHAGEARL